MVRHVMVLCLDDPAAAAVRRLSLNLALRRTPDRVSDVEVPPHVTLAACTGLDVDRFRPLAAELAAHRQPIACTLASVGVFPSVEGVLFLAPAVSADLVQLQSVMVERLRQTGAEIEPYWVPGQWVPHCTLAIGIPHEMLGAAVGQTLADFKPITGDLVRLSLYAIEPTALHYEFPLGLR